MLQLQRALQFEGAPLAVGRPAAGDPSRRCTPPPLVRCGLQQQQGRTCASSSRSRPEALANFLGCPMCEAILRSAAATWLLPWPPAGGGGGGEWRPRRWLQPQSLISGRAAPPTLQWTTTSST